MNEEVERRADVVGIFPNETSITRPVGGGLFEQNGEWQTVSGYMQVEAFAKIDRNETSIARPVGAGLFEQNDAWQTASGYIEVEAFAKIDRDETDPILSIEAARP